MKLFARFSIVVVSLAVLTALLFFQVCETLDRDQRQQITAARKEDVRQAWDLLDRWLDLDEGHAKPIILHVCRQPGVCHNCEQPIPRGSLMCSHCLAVTLDW